jgi:methionyl-tRNA synthetase
MDTITYDDFAKLQIVVGTITAVELVPDSNKLLKLTVDIGGETPRQILSGIRS